VLAIISRRFTSDQDEEFAFHGKVRVSGEIVERNDATRVTGFFPEPLHATAT
jgi:hypothetical protein